MVYARLGKKLSDAEMREVNKVLRDAATARA
jgi:hypothetical protein